MKLTEVLELNRLKKSILYRISATGIGQAVVWVMFGNHDINVLVLMIDTIQFGWYYIFEKITEQRK